MFWKIKLVWDNDRLVKISKFNLDDNNHFELGNFL